MCGGTMRVGSWPGYVSDCPWCGYSCVFASDLAAMETERRAERAMMAGGILAGTGVPELFWDVRPDYPRADRIATGGSGLYIVGGNGTAKTLMAAAVAKAYAEQGRSVRFASSVKMLADFKDTYGTAKSESEVFDELNGCDLLVIDDLGKENPTSWTAAMLYAVIDGRYGSKRPVVVTTNYAEGELVARIAQSSDESTARALMSRLMEMTETVELDGPDRRLG
jgi:DNA replication protein DnaC